MPPTPQTKRSTRKLSEVARHVVMPTGIVSTGWPAVYARIREFGDSFDEWQQGAGKVMLGKRASGEYAATIGGITLSIPRQVAKTYMIGRIVFALCTIFPKFTVLWTAHRTRTTSKTFASLQGFARKKSVAPFVSKIRTVNGEQEIHFTNGSIIMFGAREQGFGRGFDEVDVEVFDEAQILTEKALEDMVAATNQSRHEHGALLFFMGTPPRPIDPGEAFKARRREVLELDAQAKEDPDVEIDAVYIECSADRDANPDDRKQWEKANPSFPHRTPLRSMLRLRKNLPSDESWLREALGIWDSDDSGSRLVSAELWDRQGRDAEQVAALRAAELNRTFGITFSLDGKRVAVAGGMKHAGGAHAEVVDGFSGHMSEGLDALAEWLADGSRLSKTALYAISGRSHAEVLSRKLVELGVPRKAVHILNSPEYFTACSGYETGLRDGSVTHSADEGANQSILDRSVAVCDKKLRGTAGSWSWEVTVPGGDETPLEAVSVAVWASLTTKRRPGRKSRAVVLG